MTMKLLFVRKYQSNVVHGNRTLFKFILNS